jgi:hypothetical protein
MLSGRAPPGSMAGLGLFPASSKKACLTSPIACGPPLMLTNEDLGRIQEVSSRPPPYPDAQILVIVMQLKACGLHCSKKGT